MAIKEAAGFRDLITLQNASIFIMPIMRLVAKKQKRLIRISLLIALKIIDWGVNY